MDQRELTYTIEALLFASDQPLTISKLREVIKEPKPQVVENPSPALASDETVQGAAAEEDANWKSQVQVAIGALREKYSGPQTPVVILEVAEGWQFATNPIYSPWIKKLFKDRVTFRLSQPALETLAIIAYRQPITRAEVEEIRGVEVIAALETLLERNFIKVAGRKETVGRPLLYATTPEFLRQFGLRALGELPKLEAVEEEAQAQTSSVSEVSNEESSSN